jgi:hypothetical protein
MASPSKAWQFQWTIAVRGGGELLATGKAEVFGTEKVRLELVAGNEQKP